GTQDLTVEANNVSGGAYGIVVNNYGTGDTNVTSTGTVSGTGPASSGINAFNSSTANDLTVNAKDVTGDIYGIYANNTGTGDTTVKATGTASGTGAAGIGIYAINSGSGNDITVEAVDVEAGGAYGIY